MLFRYGDSLAPGPDSGCGVKPRCPRANRLVLSTQASLGVSLSWTFLHVQAGMAWKSTSAIRPGMEDTQRYELVSTEGNAIGYELKEAFLAHEP